MAEVVTRSGALASARERFSALQTGFVFLDAPGGSQVPDEVGDAIAIALREASANLGAGYETSFRVKEILEEAEAKAARFLGCAPHEVTFGPNMTSLNFVFSRTAGRDFAPGDEIIVSSLDHDGGVAPWRELAADRDLVLKHVELHPDTTYDFDDLRSKLSDRTRVVAFAWASNAVGTITDAAEVCRIAHEAGALAWIDAVHYAVHEPIDVRVGRRRRPPLLPLQVLRSAPRHRLRARGGLLDVAPVQGDSGPQRATWPPVRDRHPPVRAAGRLQRDDRLSRFAWRV